MTGYYFDAEYCEVASLRDGDKVHLRLIRPTDKDLLQAGFQRMSPQSRYRRFLAAKVRLTAAELRYLTELDHVDHLAIAAEHLADPDRLEGVGVARFVRYQSGGDVAEAAVAVIDDFQGRGLGSLLLQRLIAAARERGIIKLRFEVLSQNRPMHELLNGLARDATCIAHDGGVAVIDFDLPDLDPGHSPEHPPRDSSLYRLFSMAATGAVDLRAMVPGLSDKIPSGTASPERKN